MTKGIRARLDILEQQAQPKRTMAVIYCDGAKTFDRWPWAKDARELSAEEVAAIRADHDPIFIVKFDGDRKSDHEEH